MWRALAVAIALAACGDNLSPPDAGELSCTFPEAACEGSCVNLLEDERDCGSCGNACEAGEVCVAGDCQSGTPASPGGGVWVSVSIGASFATTLNLRTPTSCLCSVNVVHVHVPVGSFGIRPSGKSLR